MGRLAQAVKEGNDVVVHRRPLLGAPDQYAVLAQRAQTIDPLSVCMWLDTAHLPNGRPAMLYGWIGTKARFVKVKQFALPRQRSLPQRPDYRSGVVEGVCIPFFLKLYRHRL
jgi:hypothetical protein